MKKPEELRKISNRAIEQEKQKRDSIKSEKAKARDRARQIEDAQIKAKIEEAETRIEHAANDGKFECTLIAKIKTHTDEKDSRFVREVREYFENKGFKTEFRYDHDGVGIEAWHNLVVSWEEDEEEIETNDEPEGVYAKSVNDYTHTSEMDFNKAQVPVYRGCRNVSGCFCTGKCREIVGYRDKLPGES